MRLFCDSHFDFGDLGGGGTYPFSLGLFPDVALLITTPLWVSYPNLKALLKVAA
jgi:hypothetical protein